MGPVTWRAVGIGPLAVWITRVARTAPVGGPTGPLGGGGPTGPVGAGPMTRASGISSASARLAIGT